MEGYCGICLNQRPNVEWNYLTYRLECSAHRSADLTIPLTAAPKTEVIDARSVSDIGEQLPSASWAEVDVICSRMTGVLDANDREEDGFAYQRWLAHRAAHGLSVPDWPWSLHHAPNCWITMGQNERGCDCGAAARAQGVLNRWSKGWRPRSEP